KGPRPLSVASRRQLRWNVENVDVDDRPAQQGCHANTGRTGQGAHHGAVTIPDGPLAPRSNRDRITPVKDLVDLWRHRELVRHLVDRDLRVRYKQSWLGWAWALITPLITIVLFTVFFKR